MKEDISKPNPNYVSVCDGSAYVNLITGEITKLDLNPEWNDAPYALFTFDNKCINIRT